MTYDLVFEQLVEYNTRIPDVTIDIELRLGDSYVPLAAKIDTGSDRCIFSRDYGERLGLEIETGEEQRFGTATGSFLAFGHPITLITGEYSFDSTVYFASDEAFDRNVLGRFGWLDRMVIGINDYEGKLYLKSHDSE
jgi:hypothetical protein